MPIAPQNRSPRRLESPPTKPHFLAAWSIGGLIRDSFYPDGKLDSKRTVSHGQQERGWRLMLLLWRTGFAFPQRHFHEDTGSLAGGTLDRRVPPEQSGPFAYSLQAEAA